MHTVTKAITVRYFAVLREQSGLSEENLETAAGTYGELYEELSKRHRFTLPQDRVRVSVNEQFRSMDEAILEQGRVVFIPPVAGG